MKLSRLTILLLASASAPAEEITSDPATWPADVKTAYDDIRSMPVEKKAEVKAALFELAARGRLARPAIGALADDAALPEPQRALGGILFAHFARFDPAALGDLERLCARSNHKILRWSAMRELAKKGDDGKAALRKLLEAADEPLKPNIEKLLEAEGK